MFAASHQGAPAQHDGNDDAQPSSWVTAITARPLNLVADRERDLRVAGLDRGAVGGPA
jgi:hypothetical protein